jgi:hypothetical protein
MAGFNYEAVDMETGESIYNGQLKSQLVNEVIDYISNSNQLDIDDSDLDNVNNMLRHGDIKGLQNIGIKLYINKL